MSNALGVVLALDVDEVLVRVRVLSEELLEVDALGSMSSWPERKPTASARLPTG